MQKKWQVRAEIAGTGEDRQDAVVDAILKDRGIGTPAERERFLSPPDAFDLTASDVGIEGKELARAISRIQKAIRDRESIVVYADYDADGITAGAVMWETLWKLGARAMPYIPHRVEEGYGLSEKGIESVRTQHDPSLIITVDHGITAREKVAFAKKLGIDVIVTDHHVKPGKLPECAVVHTTNLAGSGVSWFVAKELAKASGDLKVIAEVKDLLSLAALGTVADLVPLVGPNRSVAKYGISAMRRTRRVGLIALMTDAGITKESVETYTISHVLAPRLNAMGRLEHALDALRLLCTTDADRARLLAEKIGLTNKERQQLTEDTVVHAHGLLPTGGQKLIFIAHESYNQGIIGLVAGRLTEEYYRPSIVVSVGEGFSKASARSIPGFNIIEAIRSAEDLLVDAGGHPMAAGFTVETKNIAALQKRLEELAERELDGDKLIRILRIDAEMPLSMVSVSLWKRLQEFAPFGIGNFEPVFASRDVTVTDARVIGATRKHLKLTVTDDGHKTMYEAIAFNMADMFAKLTKNGQADMAYAVDMNEWNGTRRLQLKVKDIQYPQ